MDPERTSMREFVEIPLASIFGKMDGFRKTDMVAPAMELQFTNTEKGSVGLSVQGKVHTISDQGKVSLAARLNYPTAGLFHEKLSNETRNKILDEVRTPGSQWLMRHRDDEIKFVASDKYKVIDNDRLVPLIRHMAEKGDFGTAKVQHLTVSDDYMSMRMVFPDRGWTKPNGMPMYPGLILRNSETGLSNFALTAMLFDLICTNGTIITHREFNVTMRHFKMKGVQDNTFEWNDQVRQRIDDALWFAETMYRKTSEPTIKVDEVAKLLRYLDDKYQTRVMTLENVVEVDKIVAATAKKEERSMVSLFDIASAITDMSQQYSSVRRDRLDELGGYILRRSA